MNHFNVIAKFGGSSVAQPGAVLEHVRHEQPDIVVVSAPGRDPDNGYDTKVTDDLLALEAGRASIDDIQRRFGSLAVAMAERVPMSDLEPIVARIPQDVATWQSHDWPLAALGEYWSSQLYARYLDYQWVDAVDLIKFDAAGKLDLLASEQAIRSRLQPDVRYIVPGFYGADPAGDVMLLERDGSNVTSAVISRALDIPEYHNWSDVSGFMTKDPRVHQDSELLGRLSFDDVLAMADDGCRLLHPDVCRILGETTISVIMRNTFAALGNRGTVIAQPA